MSSRSLGSRLLADLGAVTRRWPLVLVLLEGAALALALSAWERPRTPVGAGWDRLLLLVTLPLAAALLWRLAGAALAAWGALDATQAAARTALAGLPVLLLAAAPGRRAAPVALGLAFAVLLGLAWRHRPPAGTRAARGRAALAAGAAAARAPLALVVLALLLVDLRALHLAADPPVDLGPSGGAWTDPGEWAHNARNKLLYGAWVWDEVNFMYVSPVTTLAYYLVFRLFGVGYPQVGLVSVLFSLVTLPLFYLSLRAALGRGGALLAVLLLGGSSLYVTYNRVGLVETPAVFFQVLTLYLAERGTRDARFFALAGATSLVPLVVKMQMAYIFPAALLAVLLWSLGWSPRPDGTRSLRPVALFLAGAAAGLLVLAGLWLVPYRAEIQWRLANEWRLHALPMTVGRLGRNVLRNPFFVYFLGSPVLVLLAGLGFCGVLLRLLRGREPVPFAHLFAAWWFAGGFTYLAISQYRPLRYYVSLVPPLTILAAGALVRLWRARATTVPPPGPLAVWVYGGAAFLAGLTAAGYLYARSTAVQDVLGVLGLYPLTERELALGTAALVLAAAALVFRFLAPGAGRWLGRLPAWTPRAVATLLVAALLVGEGVRYVEWKRARTYKLVSISRALGARLPPGAVLAGIYAPILTLENRHRSLAIWERYGNWQGDPLGRYGVTHVAVMAYIDEIGYYQRRFPDAMRRARLLDEWILWKTRVSLYELPRDGAAR